MSTTIIISITLILAIVFGTILIPNVVRLSHKLHLYDVPDHRKIHKLPIPRLAGTVFLPTVTIVITLILVILLRLGNTDDNIWKNTSDINHFMAYIAGVMMIYSIGLYDDLIGVSYKIKFIVQILAATILCISGLWIADFSHVFFIDKVPWWIGMPITILSVTYITNATNLIDGIDGLASGLCIIALAVLASLNYILGYTLCAMLSVAMLGVLLPFFYFNVFGRKDKTFMGDAGSLTLGFTISFLILHFWQRNPVWDARFHNVGIVAISTFIIPMFDVVRVMLSRIRDHRDPFLPDKNHIHHKLLRTGIGAKMTMVILLLISIFFITFNYFTAAYLSQTIMLISDIVLFCITHIIINIFIYKEETKTGIKWSRIFKQYIIF